MHPSLSAPSTLSILKTLGASVVGALALASAAQARAISLPPLESGQTRYMFQGLCVDCAAAAGEAEFFVSAQLVLQDHLPGAELTDDQFVSFAYFGSNLLDPFFVGSQTAPTGFWHHPYFEGFGHYVNGQVERGNVTIDTLSMVFGDALQFELKSDGTWFTCGAKGDQYYAVACNWTQNQDIGIHGVFTPAAVPEPSAIAMMGLGLAAVGGLARRRERVAPRTAGVEA